MSDLENYSIGINGTINTTDGIANAWYNGDWVGGLSGPFINIMGETVFALFLIFWIVSGTWVFTRSVSLTWVVMILIGGTLASGLPGQAQAAGWLILFFGAGYALWKVYSRQTR